MKSHLNAPRCATRSLVVLLALAVAPAADAVMYKWIDDSGSVTYSNTPPPDPSKVKGFIVLEDVSSGSADKRPQADVAPDSPRREAEAAKADIAPRAVTRASPTEAVQDPCLRSSDPQCHQRHKDKYHPYLGYAPSARAVSGAAAPVGATGSTAGGGAVGGYVSISPGVSPPAKSSQPAAPAAIHVKTK